MGNNSLKSNYLNKKINIFTLLICVLIILFFIYSVVILIDSNNKEDKSNILRIETSLQKEKIKKMFNENKYYMENEFYDYAVINLKGEVIFSHIKGFSIGEKVNLETEIGFDNAFNKDNKGLIRYSIPLVSGKAQEGIIIIDLPNEVLYNSNNNIKLIPLVILSCLIIILALLINMFVKGNIIKPIQEIHNSTRTILKGGYDCKINYDYHGEVGELCHDFESMRDEIKASKEKEEKLKRSEKELLASISHDLKTPLSSISGYVEGIRDEIVRDEVGIQRYSNIILKKCKEISKLIDDVLEQSKAELNEMSIVREEIYSDEYLEEILEEISLDVATYNMNLIVNGELPRALIFIDALRINQVINNIVSNAIKYSKPGDRVDVFIEDKADKIIINIKDQGIGISIEDIPFVFNKFYRGEKHRNTNIIGSGLGLSISKYIVESHGGSIKCVSALEGGTTMSFTIPKI